ncbi:MAG TPA: uracil-DNA glycosylase family protein [Candidatus Hydrogenedentes bacterium]|nr:uracil-DNA glycosylase family protein [Candidatus Hydrogenedentota bacterium]HPG67392.1 uracil-DNA glycosylase family protein [Candidatus Hydrogenedentota bacterium]
MDGEGLDFAETPRALDALLAEVRACRQCADVLPLGPRPVVRGRASARILIVGQAPGTKVHETGIPWNDPSGDRLRKWLHLDRERFYDESRIAIIPMGYCYPGRNARGGDLPPRPECARLWLDRLRALLPRIELTLLVGGYAQRHYLGARAGASLTETVRAWREYAPAYFPLPHPSFRNLDWMKRNPWFEREVVPALREAAERILGPGSAKN